MPDTLVQPPESERFESPADKPPVGTQMGPHDFIESEFEQGAGRCDVCGGGPDAKIHRHVDPMERIAAALEGLLEVERAILLIMETEHDWECDERLKL